MLNQVHVARQPVFNAARQVFAYELLFRPSSTSNTSNVIDGNAATSCVISDSFLQSDLDQVTCGKPAFINFTQDLLLSEVALLLPPGKVVIEVLEDVEADPEVLEAIKKLRRKGHRVALDDFIAIQDENKALLDVADIIKVDFLGTNPEDRQLLVSQLHAMVEHPISLLAEKVETYDQYREGLELGFKYFQGFFFASPSLLTQRAVPAQKAANLRVLQEVHKPTLCYASLEEVIKADVSLTTRLLRYINAAAFPWRQQIDSVKQTLALLGEKQVRRWASVVLLAGMAADKPIELAVTSCIRGRMCEALQEQSRLDVPELDCFLVGSLSTLDAILDVPLEQGLASLPVSDGVRAALLRREGRLGQLLELTLQYEQGNWAEIGQICGSLGVSEDRLPGAYLEALQWSSKIFGTEN